MNGVNDVGFKVHVTVLAVVQKLRVLDGHGWVWSAWLAVSYAGNTRAGTWFAAWACHWTAVPLTMGWPRFRASGRGALGNAC